MMNQEGGRPCSTASVNTRFGTAAFLCSATLGVVLATGSVFAAVPPALQFIRHDIDQGAFGQITEGINVGDIDGDGRPDIVVGGDNYLVWFHNPDWAPHLIASGFKFAGGAMVVVRDMDGDGRLDVMTGKYPLGHEELRQTVWFGNTPSGWAEHLVSSTSFCHDLAFGDFDGDGHVDAVCDDQLANQIVWLHGPASPTSEWPTTLTDPQRAMGAAVADIDRDGRPDVVAGRAWYRLSGGTWSRFPYTTLNDTSDGRFDDFEKVSVLDIDGDGRLDVFATLFTDSREGQVYAFLAPPDPTTPWTAVQIDPGPLFGVHSQAVGEFDGTSRPQIMVGGTNIGGFGFGVNPSPQIYIYRLLGAASDPDAWERALVDNTGTHEARAVDLNGDGLPDIAGDEENTDLVNPPRNGRISWWQNVTAVGGTTTPTTTVVAVSTTTTTPTSGATSTTLQVVLQPGPSEGVDTYLTAPASSDSNWGTLARAWVGTDERNAQRALLRFTLGGVPAGATVLACTLTVEADAVDAPLPGHAWRVTQPGWTETGATWNRYDGTHTWATPGGDVDATSGIPFAPPVVSGPFAFPDLTALCRDAIAARGGRLDLLIQQDTEMPGAPQHQWSFVTSDDTANPATRPKLIATFGAAASTSTPSTTTTTTLPGCGTAATFQSITCRLVDLETRVELDVAGSAFRTNLLAMLQGRVLKKVQQAEQRATPRDRHRARAHLGEAARGLKNFVRRLNSPRGHKAVPQPSGQAMGEEARALRKAIAGLAGSL